MTAPVAGPLRRRTWLQAAALGGAGAVLAGCQPTASGPVPLALPPCRWVGPDPARGHRLRALAGGKSGTLPPPAVQRRTGVLVLGGGVAGLSALRRLAEAGVDDAQLLELHDTVGGNALGHTLAGMACPQGAHYLPVPGPAAHEVSAWLHDIGLLRSDAAGVHANERHLCHAPQERLFIDGAWQPGLLPSAEGRPATLAQYRHFARTVAGLRQRLAFAMPSLRARWSPGLAELDGQPLAAWLAAQGLNDERLLAHLDYCCRDDYGAGIDTVSAWAGVHYFASRHGFQVPGDDVGDDERDPVFTFPEGNAWLVAALAAPLRARLHTGRTVLRVQPGATARRPHTVLAWDEAAQRLEAWQADTLVLATPLHVSARLLPDWADPLATALRQAAAAQPHAPWLVANLHLAAPLLDRLGAPPAWDNVRHAPAGRGAPLGYVDASHQGFRPHAGPTVITLYQALPPARRAELLQAPPEAWAGELLADLAELHPDAPQQVRQIDLTRWGHAMAIPVPGQRGSAALAALREASARPGARLRLAHADLVGYSVFEEAFTLGWQAGQRPA